MNLKELKDKRLTAEEDIRSILYKLQNETGILVTSLEFEFTDVSVMGKKPSNLIDIAVIMKL